MCYFSLGFLNFYALAFVGFVSLSKDVFIILCHFYFTISDSYGTLHLALCLTGIHSAVASIWVVTRILIISDLKP